MEEGEAAETAAPPAGRRSFLATASSLAMLVALVESYGTFASYSGRFLLPTQKRRTGWLIVGTVDAMAVGESRPFGAPDGATINVARQTAHGTVDDFVALSSTCPHLGCQVRYEAPNHRFVCPCHNGTFDASGHSLSGPPFDAHQSLPLYPLKIESGLLYIEVPLERNV
jgi:nitrite reductase/ring-hydroxylating ferredoxin subunit